MKRITLYVMLILLLIFIGSSWFLLNTQWGLERAYDLVTHSVPGTLRIQSLRGELRGPIRLFGISYTDDGIDIKLDRLEVDWRLASLLTGTLHITDFDAQGLTIKQTATTKQRKSETPTSFALPFSLVISQAQLTGASIRTGSQPPFSIHQINLKASASDRTLQLAHLSIETDLFDLTTKGIAGLDINEPFDLTTIWTLRYANYPALNGRGNFTGTLKKLKLAQTIRQAGLDLHVHGQLNNIIERLGWQLTLDIRQLDAQQLVASWPAITAQGKLLSQGRVAGFTLSGELLTSIPKQGTLHSTFQLETQPHIWRLTSFKTTHQPTHASLYANGEWQPGPDDLGSLTLSGGWNQLRLPLVPSKQTNSLVSNKGAFALNGKLDAYQFNVTTDLTGQQLPDTLLNISGHGSQQQITLSNIKASTLDGKILGSALVEWHPDLNWETSLTIHGVNPAIKWRDWPGQLNGELQISRKQTENQPLDIIDLKKLDGKLRGYAVSGHGKVNLSSRKLEIDNIALNMGDSRLQISGSRNKDWNLQAQLTSPDVHNLWPYSRGKLDLETRVSGPRLTPHIISKINGENIVFEEYRIGGIIGDIDIDLQSDEQFITGLTLQNIAKGGREWQSVVLRANGTRTKHQINLELKQDTDLVRLVVNGNLTEQQIWHGVIAQTLVDIKEFGKWQQNQPAAFSFGIEQGSLEAWCLNQPDAHICIQGEGKQNIWNARLEAHNLSLALLENWMPPHLNIRGTSNINTTIHYHRGRELFGDILVSIPNGFHLKVVETEESFRFAPGNIQASLDKSGLAARIDLPAYDLGKLMLRIDLPAWNALTGLQPSQPITGQVTASLASLAHLNGFFLDSPVLTGSVNTELRFDGTIGAPLIIGETFINQASMEIPALGIKLSDINLHAHSKTGRRIDYRFSARSGQTEPLTLSGYTHLNAPDGWPTSLNIRGADFQLVDLPDIKMHIAPQLDVKIEGQHIDLKGQVTIPQALFRPRTLPRTSVSSSRDVVFVGEKESPLTEERWKISSHVRVILGDHVYFDGFGLRGEISGDLQLMDEPGKLTLGQGEIRITEGTYKAYGQDAKIRRGRLIFTNTVIDNPAIDLEAVREVDTVTAGVRVTGTLKQPELTLFSEPAMSESDIASYFLLGRPMETGEDSEGQQLQRALLAARLAGGELLVDQTGIYSYIDEVSFETDKATEQTSLVVGKYLSPKLYVRYVTGVVESSNIVEVHYKLKRYLRIQTETGYRGSKSVAGADIYYTIEH